MRVKICGITSPEDASAAYRAGADAIGLIFAEGSSRVISIGRAREVVAAVGPLMTTVGVFRPASRHYDDEEIGRVLDVARELRLHAVQLHGQLDSSQLGAFRGHVTLIRAVPFTPELSRTELEGANADAVLLDSSRPGSGRSFDWTAAAHLRGISRLILAGGLDPDNVTEAVRALAPAAVDVSSGVESSPGVKDERLVRSFVARARGAALVTPA